VATGCATGFGVSFLIILFTSIASPETRPWNSVWGALIFLCVVAVPFVTPFIFVATRAHAARKTESPKPVDPFQNLTSDQRKLVAIVSGGAVALLVASVIFGLLRSPSRAMPPPAVVAQAPAAASPDAQLIMLQKREAQAADDRIKAEADLQKQKEETARRTGELFAKNFHKDAIDAVNEVHANLYSNLSLDDLSTLKDKYEGKARFYAELDSVVFPNLVDSVHCLLESDRHGALKHYVAARSVTQAWK